jgi:hypothetical protein
LDVIIVGRCDSPLRRSRLRRGRKEPGGGRGGGEAFRGGLNIYRRRGRLRRGLGTRRRRDLNGLLYWERQEQPAAIHWAIRDESAGRAVKAKAELL